MPDAPTAGFDDGVPHFEPKPATDNPLKSLLTSILNSLPEDELALRGSDFQSVTGELMHEYITKEAKLDQSLVQQAINRLADFLPGDISPKAIANRKEQITPEEEAKIRMHAAGVYQTIFYQLQDISGMNNFSTKVYQRLGQIERYAGKEIATSLNISDIQYVEPILVQSPQILKRGEGRMFAFQNPDSPGGTIEDYYFVSGEKENRELAQLILDSPHLIKYYVATYIFDIQKRAINTIHEKITSVHENLKTKANELTQDANAVSQDHFYMLLFKESEQKPIRMTRIHRVDPNTFSSATENMTPTIAHIQSYIVSKSGPDEIMIEQFNAQAKKMEDETINKFPKTFVDRLFIQIMPDGKYRFGTQDQTSHAMTWADSLSTLEGSRLKSFLQYPNVILHASDLYHVEDRSQLLTDAKASTVRIQHTQSLLECIQQIHAEGLADYPSSEMIFELDATTFTPPNPESVKYN